jgi:flagellar assembly protein FliH
LSSRVYKNYQISIGMPFSIKSPLSFSNKKTVRLAEENVRSDSIKQLSKNAEEMLKNAREQSELIIKEAQLEAERIIADAERKADELAAQIEEQFKQKGYEEGFNKGHNEGIKQYEALIKEAEDIKIRAIEEYDNTMESIEGDMISLVTNVAKKVLDTELSINRESILNLIKESINKCSCSNSVVLKISSEDYDFVAENKDKLLTMLDECDEFEIKKDSSLSRGSCIVETDHGSVDSSVDTRLKKIEETFKKLIGE